MTLLQHAAGKNAVMAVLVDEAGVCCVDHFDGGGFWFGWKWDESGVVGMYVEAGSVVWYL